MEFSKDINTVVGVLPVTADVLSSASMMVVVVAVVLVVGDLVRIGNEADVLRNVQSLAPVLDVQSDVDDLLFVGFETFVGDEEGARDARNYSALDS